MMLFLQSSARLSTCYSYIGIAMASALRMGLHRSLPAHFNLIERETRKRVFWLIRRVDVYVGALLGLPKTLADEDIDQDYAMEVDDEYITEDVILPMPEGKISLMAAANAHLRLTRILAKVIKYVYPIKGIKRSANARTVQSYVVSYARIKEIQEDMQEWMDQLPMQLRIGGEASSALLRFALSWLSLVTIVSDEGTSQGSATTSHILCSPSDDPVQAIPALPIETELGRSDG